MTEVAPRARVEDLLGQGNGFDVLYGGFLSDHLPMALQALWHLGASGEQLAAFHRRYAAKLSPLVPSDDTVEGDAWRDALGRRAAYAAFRVRLERELDADGVATVLGRWLPRLLDGAAADAFHPLIRLAHGVENGFDREVAAGLAYFASVWSPLPAARQRVEPSPSAAAAFARLRADPSFAQFPFRRRFFGMRVAELARSDAFADARGYRGDNFGIDDLAREALAIFRSTGDFFALHMVTATRAVRVLAPSCADARWAIDVLWHALAAAYLVIGAPAYGAPSHGDRPAPSPSALLDAVLAASDVEHAAKLAHACIEEGRLLGDPGYDDALAEIVAPAARA